MGCAAPARVVAVSALLVLLGLGAGVGDVAGLARAAPQGAALRTDPAARPVAVRKVVPIVHLPASSTAAASAPSSASSPAASPDPRTAARDARMAALQARLDALDADEAGLDDAEERLVMVSDAGTLDPIHRQTLERYVDMLRPGAVAVLAEACATPDDVGGARLHAALARAFDAAGAIAWTVRAQRVPCGLPGGVVLRPAR